MITYGLGTYAGVLTVITGDIADVPGVVRTALLGDLTDIQTSADKAASNADKAASNAALAAALSA